VSAGRSQKTHSGWFISAAQHRFATSRIPGTVLGMQYLAGCARRLGMREADAISTDALITFLGQLRDIEERRQQDVWDLRDQLIRTRLNVAVCSVTYTFCPVRDPSTAFERRLCRRSRILEGEAGRARTVRSVPAVGRGARRKAPLRVRPSG
jgi:hypothetical protein